MKQARIPQQAKLRSAIGRKEWITCEGCAAGSDGTVVASYTGVRKCPNPEFPFFPYPDMILVQCGVCGRKQPQCGGPDGRFYPCRMDLYEDEYAWSSYREAVMCVSDGLPIATVMLCRKVLMLIAVDLGGKKINNYREAVDYIRKTELATSVNDILEYLRLHGNDANHLPEPPSKQLADRVFLLTAAVLHTVCNERMCRIMDIVGPCE